MKYVIVSRHPAAVDFIKANAPEFASATVLSAATPDDVRGAVVAGNLPLHLACFASQVIAVEFAGDPPRGAEYGQAEMNAAGAKLARYVVSSVVSMAESIWNDGIGPRGRRSKLIVGSGDSIHEFTGFSIPGVVTSVRSDYEKKGKWSNTTYSLKMSRTAWTYMAKQSWEEGEWFHGCSATEVVAKFHKAGCTAPDQAIRDFLVRTFPRTMERIAATESAIAYE